jgi:hypothetical protein
MMIRERGELPKIGELTIHFEFESHSTLSFCLRMVNNVKQIELRKKRNSGRRTVRVIENLSNVSQVYLPIHTWGIVRIDGHTA